MNSIDEARRLRVLADDQKIPTGKGPALFVPAVSPNHVGILSPTAGDGEILPMDAWELLVGGVTGVPVTPLTDSFLTPFPGVALPHVHLGG